MCRLLLIIFVLLPAFLKSQNQSSDPDYYQRILVEFFDKPDIGGRHALISKDSISFRNTYNRQLETCGLDEVQIVRAKIGNKLGSGILYGFAIGVGYFILESIVVATSDKYDFRDDALPRYLLSTGILTAIGGLIGSTIPEYKTVYRGSRPKEEALLWQLSPYGDNYSNGLSFRLKLNSKLTIGRSLRLVFP